MTLVLDAGGLSALTQERARLAELRRRGLWPAQVPSVVLTGDHRRDSHTNRLLRARQVRDVDETVARDAARLRTATGRARAISAVDAVVVAHAAVSGDALVLTTDPRHIRALADQATVPIAVVAM